MASFSQNELSWGRLLTNLGYKDKEKYLNNRDLFVVPNKDAFQKVGLFFGLLISLIWMTPFLVLDFLNIIDYSLLIHQIG